MLKTMGDDRFLRLLWMVLAVLISRAGWCMLPGAEAWKTTDLDSAFSKTFISNEKCNSSEFYGLACHQALQATAKLLHLPPPTDAGESVDFERKFQQQAETLPPDIPAQMFWGVGLNALLMAFDAHAYLRPALDPVVGDIREYVGIGATMVMGRRGFFVSEIFPGSPAAASGLSYGDLITTITRDDHTTQILAGHSQDEVSEWFHGPRGTRLTLSLNRLDGSTTELKIPRQPLKISSLDFFAFPRDPDFGYIRLRQFIGGQACGGVRMALDILQRAGVRFFILDLRGNPGGTKQEALCINGLFLGPRREQIASVTIPVVIPNAALVHVFDSTPGLRWQRGYALNPETLPLVVLMDEHSASSSEIVAGVLQYFHSAWVVGRTSFGKGTEQTTDAMEGHNSLILSATSALFFFPNLKSNQRVGITPSFPLPLARGIADADLIMDREPQVHPNSLPAFNEPWEDDRQEEIAKIRACIERDKLEEYFLKRLDIANGDLPWAYGAAVLKCAEAIEKTP